MSESDPETSLQPYESGSSRRGFVSTTCATVMGAGLVASYGTFFSYAGRYLYPAHPPEQGWMFVVEIARLKMGESLPFFTPAGESVAITRQGEAGTVEDFIALSSTCPHMGCHVHWEGFKNRYFCPCHNGVFNPQGVAISGPPADAGQSLSRYPLKIKNGLLFIKVGLEVLAETCEPMDGTDGSEVC